MCNRDRTKPPVVSAQQASWEAGHRRCPGDHWPSSHTGQEHTTLPGLHCHSLGAASTARRLQGIPKSWLLSWCWANKTPIDNGFKSQKWVTLLKHSPSLPWSPLEKTGWLVVFCQIHLLLDFNVSLLNSLILCAQSNQFKNHQNYAKGNQSKKGIIYNRGKLKNHFQQNTFCSQVLRNRTQHFYKESEENNL